MAGQRAVRGPVPPWSEGRQGQVLLGGRVSASADISAFHSALRTRELHLNFRTLMPRDTHTPSNPSTQSRHDAIDEMYCNLLEETGPNILGVSWRTTYTEMGYTAGVTDGQFK